MRSASIAAAALAVSLLALGLGATLAPSARADETPRAEPARDDGAIATPPAAPMQGSCGDGQCQPPEDCNSCPSDCGSCCGDGRCAPPEDCNSCPTDCGSCCGDYRCNPPEDCNSCPRDCGPCTPPPG